MFIVYDRISAADYSGRALRSTVRQRSPKFLSHLAYPLIHISLVATRDPQVTRRNIHIGNTRKVHLKVLVALDHMSSSLSLAQINPHSHARAEPSRLMNHRWASVFALFEAQHGGERGDCRLAQEHKH